VNLLPLLLATRRLEDLPGLAAALGCRPEWQEIPPSCWRRRPADPLPCIRSARIGERLGLAWYGIEGVAPERACRRIAGVLLRRGEPATVLGFDAGSGRIALSVAFHGQPVLTLMPQPDDRLLRTCVERIRTVAGTTSLAQAARLAEILGLEAVGDRFFRAFEEQLGRLSGSISGCRRDDRRSLALLQLTRVLFLYFVQSKGWLNGKPDFLRAEVDRCLAGNRSIDRHLLRPLFFGTLNRAWQERTRGARAFGRIPFLNGGLFEPHPLERQWDGSVPNPAWRDAFDSLFERFQFTAAEGEGAAVAPDMLGRVFEGVMVPAERRQSGTFYTPPGLVRALLDACLELVTARSPGAGLAGITLLDPAVGSGAFLLAALERIAGQTRTREETVSAARRRVLTNNLFGVDLNPTAVRLTELRLWLSVIADDDTGSPESVEPLPNLDCLVRQGDSLVDPLGLVGRMPFHPGAMGRALAELRQAFIAANGKRKREAARVLRAAERRAMHECLVLAERRLDAGVAALIRAARAPDLFGGKTGMDRPAARRIGEHRSQLVSLRSARRRLEREGEVGWFQYESHFSDVFAVRGGFDLVIGNPPWVRAEAIPRAVREHLRARYCWWRGERGSGAGYHHQPDLAVAFLERAHELARPGGVVGLLVPAKLASSGYGTVARRAMARDLTVHALQALGGNGPPAFDATVYPMALVSIKEKPAADHRVRLSLKPSGTEWVPQSELAGGGPWIIRGAGAAGIARELAARFPPFESAYPIHLGVKTGANRVFLNPPDSIEPHLLRQAFRGRDLRPFQVARTIPMLWPCAADGRPLDALPPAALAHMHRHRELLVARADHGPGPLWQVFRTRAARDGARLVWADLSRSLTSVALPPGNRHIPLNTCYVVHPDEDEAPALAAWLNSSWMRGLARLRADPASGGFARFNARTVASLPLPDTVRRDPRLAAWSRAAERTTHAQAELDELTASHLDLSAAALRTLAAMA
jgi:hypothetical protein